MGICPPWQLKFQSEDETVATSLGYHPVWNPPSGEHEVPEDVARGRLSVNIIRTGIQFAVVLILINLGHYVLRSKNE